MFYVVTLLMHYLSQFFSPDTTDILLHPFFWTPAKRLGFLQDASDRFEIMERDPREPPLIALEMGAFDIVGIDWHKRLDKVFVENLGKFRKYDGRSVQDLLRAFRNKVSPNLPSLLQFLLRQFVGIETSLPRSS